MAELSKQEVQAQLKKLGIHTNDELKFYSREYKKYSDRHNHFSYSLPKQHEHSEFNHPYHVSKARKIALSCRSLFPVLGNFFSLGRVKAYKKYR